MDGGKVLRARWSDKNNSVAAAEVRPQSELSPVVVDLHATERTNLEDYKTSCS